MEQSPRPGASEAIPQFSSPEEELKYLRAKVAEKEHTAWKEGEMLTKDAAISRTIHEYTKEAPQAVTNVEGVEESFVESPEYEHSLEHLNQASHREKMRPLYGIIKEKGVWKAIQAAREFNSPHFEDDFHSVLVEYIRTGAIIPGLEKETPTKRSLNMTVFEVMLPHAGIRAGEDIPKFQDAIAAMERLFSGLFPNDPEREKRWPAFSFEIENTNFSTDLVFNVAVPNELKDLFTKQVLAVFPTAKIDENANDYNPFNTQGVTLASLAVSADNFVYPIQMADDAENDPLKVILGAFAKLERDGEAASIQLIVKPDPEYVGKALRRAIGKIRDGVPIKRAVDIPLTFTGEAVKALTDFWHTQLKDRTKEKEKEEKKHLDGKAEQATKLLEEKIEHPLARVQMRAVASAATRERAETILSAIEQAFNQFHRAQGNGIKWKRQSGGALANVLHEFIYRLPNDPDETLILNTKELATIYHLPLAVTQKEAPTLKTLKAATAPAPVAIATDGIFLGKNKHRGETRDIRLGTADRLRHFYVIGQTGTGKSTFLRNMIVEDMKAGNGCCFIDPHGADVQEILAHVPKERVEDVIYFDPSYTPRPVGLNMLEYDPMHPEQKIFVVNELFVIFRQLYAKGNPESMGPAFEQYFRNATMLVLEDPETGMTMMEISRVLADKKFRDLKLSRCKNPIVVQFWREIAEKTSGEAGLANMIPYITNKFDVFLSNDVMRPIIAQEESSFNFRQIMDTKKILLVNLAKGKLGEMNANLLGLILVGKMFMAAMSRVDSFGKKLPDFYIYIDEFHNVSTPSIAGILSEARKYGLSLTIAHQYIAQLEENIKEAVFGNVGNMAVFRIGTEDAEFIEEQYKPIFTAPDMMKIENLNYYMKLLVGGRPTTPFNVEIEWPKGGHPEIAEQLKQLSYLKYGRDREMVDSAILAKYMAAKNQAPQGVGSRLVDAPTTTVTPPPLQRTIVSPPQDQHGVIGAIVSGPSFARAFGNARVASSPTAPHPQDPSTPHIPIAAQFSSHPQTAPVPPVSVTPVPSAPAPTRPAPFYVPPTPPSAPSQSPP